MLICKGHTETRLLQQAQHILGGVVECSLMSDDYVEMRLPQWAQGKEHSSVYTNYTQLPSQSWGGRGGGGHGRRHRDGGQGRTSWPQLLRTGGLPTYTSESRAEGTNAQTLYLYYSFYYFSFKEYLPKLILSTISTNVENTHSESSLLSSAFHQTANYVPHVMSKLSIACTLVSTSPYVYQVMNKDLLL